MIKAVLMLTIAMIRIILKIMKIFTVLTSQIIAIMITIIETYDNKNLTYTDRSDITTAVKIKLKII